MIGSLLLVVLACGNGNATPAGTSHGASAPTAPTALTARSDMQVGPFSAKVAAGVKVIDVRTPREFSSGHVVGAVNVPVNQIGPHHPVVQDLPKDQPIYLICAVGGRSSQAADLLASAGYTTVNVVGGTSAWIAAGHPVEK